MSDLMTDGIYMASENDAYKALGCKSKIDAKKLILEIQKLTFSPQGNAFQQLKRWRQLSKQMLLLIDEVAEAEVRAENKIQRICDQTAQRSNKRWTERVDNLLIDLVCEEKLSAIQIAAILGRSTSAIKTRLSDLVGIKRLSSEIVGKFIGTLNGANIEGNIKGQLMKK